MIDRPPSPAPESGAIRSPALAPAPAAGRPPDCNAALVLDDGSVWWGRGIGAHGMALGEVCFNTSMTGYQEIMTDPSYAGQIVNFTFPHIGNVGANREDIETTTPAARGLVLRADITDPANYRAIQHFDTWLKSYGLTGLASGWCCTEKIFLPATRSPSLLPSNSETCVATTSSGRLSGTTTKP